MGDFHRRLNQDRDRGWNERRDFGNIEKVNWDTLSRSERSSQDLVPSVRVPNVGWESTPRGGHGDDTSGWGGAHNRLWDAPTPRAARENSPDDSEYIFGIDAREWEEEQIRLDRDWYNSAEDGVVGEEGNNTFAQYDDRSIFKHAEIASKPVVCFHSLTTRIPVIHVKFLLQKKISAKQAQYVSFLLPSSSTSSNHSRQNADNDLWEANRMLTSGIASRKTIDLDFKDESESTVHVMVHDLKPPFLDGRTVFTKQLEPVNPIRDPTSDMAVFSKRGSTLVKEKREQAERAKAAAKLASLGGTSLGNIMGVKDEDADAEGTVSLFLHYSSPEPHIHVETFCFSAS